ncbi:MAG: hypothetical protein LWW94_05355 [Candidatus Desulfofervidaceae bacterium]|nr:hypothetical protein [Candidatus Desulfofervidaceae bacterium]
MDGVGSANSVLLVTGMYSLKKVFELKKDLVRTLIQSMQNQNNFQTSVGIKTKNTAGIINPKQGRVNVYA